MYILPDRPERLTAEWILSRRSQEEIFTRYLGFKPSKGTAFRNPLRGDKKPGCKFFVRSGYLWFKDFSTDEVYNCFTFIKAKENISYPQVLELVYADMIEHNIIRTIIPFYTQEEETSYSSIDVTIQNFTSTDITYLKSFCITSEVCKKYEVYSIAHYWINGEKKYAYRSNNPVLGFYFGDGTWKLYHYLNKNLRFLTNAPFSHIQGLKQLRQSNNLIITKSLKDIMVLDLMDFAAIAPHNESLSDWKEELPSLIDTFENIFLNFDNDAAGIKATEKVLAEYPSLLPLYMPEQSKDPSGHVKLYGLEQTKNHILLCQEKLLFSRRKQMLKES